MRILIGGDIVPTAENAEYFRSGDLKSLLGEELKKYWLSGDHRVFNLECAVTDVTDRIMKNGPALVAEPECMKGIAALDPSVLLLSNNHILDAGEPGLLDLIRKLDHLRIPFIGAGKNAEAITLTHVFRDGETSVGLYVCCDYEFSAAQKERAGAHIFSERSLEIIKELSKTVDHVIVIYHGGKEYFRFPSPDLQRKCRSFADAGAKFVVCQHSHCIGSEERYKESTILYGQGNFIFNKKHDDFWSTSLLIETEAGKEFRIKYIPIVQTDTGTRLATEAEGEEILSNLRRRSELITDADSLEKEFEKFTASILPSYLYTFAGWPPILSALDRKIFNSFLIRKYFSKKRLAAIWNFIATDAHREMMLRGIENCLR